MRDILIVTCVGCHAEMREKSESGGEAKVAAEVVAAAVGEGAVIWPQPQPAKDDLRAYTYEGEGSFAGSLSSALSGQISPHTRSYNTMYCTRSDVTMNR